MNIRIGKLVLSICQTNCYFLYEEGKKEVIFIDPADKGALIYQKLTEAGYTIAGILLTHGHFDHIWGSKELRELSGAKIYAYEKEREVCEDASKNASDQCGRPYTVDVDQYLKDGDEITLAGMTCKVIATPGHTVGSCCYYFEGDDILISGDTLFAESVGRTDLPTGSYSDIVHSVQDKLMCLKDDIMVYPGHGEPTTIGHERKYNPFIQ